jgi:uroporphyrinogen-III decarboxylase
MTETVIEMGGVVRLYTEEKYDSKLDLLATLPAGKVCVHLINSDMELAKKHFAGRIALSGGVDGPLLAFGRPEDVVRDVKRAIDICAPGGGYILDTSTSIDIAKPENLRALFDTVNTYMKY